MPRGSRRRRHKVPSWRQVAPEIELPASRQAKAWQLVLRQPEAVQDLRSRLAARNSAAAALVAAELQAALLLPSWCCQREIPAHSDSGSRAKKSARSWGA